MAWRGRGRGRGGGRGGFGGFGGFGFRRAKQEPFVLFPEDVVLPEHWYVKPDDPLITKKLALQRFYGASVYHIKGKDIKSMLDNQVAEVERYSDRNKSDGQINRDSLSDFVKLSSSYLPPELFEGTKMERQPKKKVRWDPDSELQKLDKYEKLEGKVQGQEKKEEKEKEEDEDENEGVVSEEEEEEESDDGDYNQVCIKYLALDGLVYRHTDNLSMVSHASSYAGPTPKPRVEVVGRHSHHTNSSNQFSGVLPTKTWILMMTRMI